VLLAAKIVENVSSLSEGGHLMIRYEIWENAEELLARIEEATQTSKLLQKLDSGLLRR